MTHWNFSAAAAAAAAAVHRREFPDFQGLWQDLSRSAVLSSAEFADFTFKTGAVWLRFNELTKGRPAVRIVALFSNTPLQTFGSLLLVACTQRGGRPEVLWRSPELQAEPSAAQVQALFAEGNTGRSMVVLPWASVTADALP